MSVITETEILSVDTINSFSISFIFDMWSKVILKIFHVILYYKGDYCKNFLFYNQRVLIKSRQEKNKQSFGKMNLKLSERLTYTL